jgi:hypothetical protein
MQITPIKIEDKVEIFVEIFTNKFDDLNLTACRTTFKEITKLFKQDELGGGLLTLTMDQARSLNADLTKILER